MTFLPICPPVCLSHSLLDKVAWLSPVKVNSSPQAQKPRQANTNKTQANYIREKEAQRSHFVIGLSISSLRRRTLASRRNNSAGMMQPASLNVHTLTPGMSETLSKPGFNILRGWKVSWQSSCPLSLCHTPCPVADCHESTSGWLLSTEIQFAKSQQNVKVKPASDRGSSDIL